MSILEDLYNGNINLTETHISNSDEYQRLNKKLVEEIEEFVLTLDAKQKHAFEMIEEGAARLNAVAEKDRFVEGARAGAQMMLELMKKDE